MSDQRTVYGVWENFWDSQARRDQIEGADQGVRNKPVGRICRRCRKRFVLAPPCPYCGEKNP